MEYPCYFAQAPPNASYQYERILKLRQIDESATGSMRDSIDGTTTMNEAYKLDCCKIPATRPVRSLKKGVKSGLDVVVCTSCDTHWLHEWAEIWMGDMDSDDVEFNTFSRLSDVETERLTDETNEVDIESLGPREALEFHGLGPKRITDWMPRS